MTLTDLRQYEIELAIKLGEHIGYGNMMVLARDGWRRSLERQGYPVGGEFAVGPCVAMTVPCGCVKRDEDDHCDWCCGSGWLTKRVKAAKDSQGG